MQSKGLLINWLHSLPPEWLLWVVLLFFITVLIFSSFSKKRAQRVGYYTAPVFGWITRELDPLLDTTLRFTQKFLVLYIPLSFLSFFLFYGASDAKNFDIGYISVFVGVITIAIAIAMFVAQFASESTERNMIMRIGLFSHNSILILFITIIIFFHYIFDSIDFLAATILPFVILVFFCAKVVIDLSRVLTGSNYFKEYQEKFLVKNLRLFYYNAVKIRTKNNKLLKSYKDDSSLQVGLFSNIKKSNFVKIKATSAGVVDDINFRKINRLLDRLKKRRHAIETLDAEILKNDNNTSNEVTDSRIMNKIDVLIGNNVKYDDVLLYVDKRLLRDVKEKEIQELQKSVNKLIKLTSKKEIDEKFDLAIKYEGLRISLFESITKGDFIKLQKNLDMRSFLLEDFLLFLKEERLGMGKAFSGNEGWMIFSPDYFYRLTEWFTVDIRRAAETIFDDKHLSIGIVREFCQFIKNIIEQSVKGYNFYFVERFLPFVITFYNKSIKLDNENKRLAKYLKDCSWRHISNIGNYILLPQTEEENNEIQQKENEALIDKFLYVYQGLIIATINAERLDDFEFFLNKLEKFGKHKRFNLSNGRNIGDVLGDDRLEIYFGLAYFILRDIEKTHKINKNFARKIFVIIREKLASIPHREIFATYGRVRKLGRDRWQWDDWAIIPDEGACFVDTHVYLDRILCTILLEKGKVSQDTIESIDLLEQILNHFEKRPNDNNTIYKELDYVCERFEEIAKCDRKNIVEKFFVEIYKNQKKRANESLKEMSLDDEEIKEFKKEFLEAYNENNDILEFLKLKEINAYKDIKEQNSIRRIGFNKVFGKEHFIKKWHVGFGGDGEYFAEGFIKRECNEIMERWFEKAKEVVSLEELLAKKPKMKKPVIITNNVYRAGIDDDENFKPEWNISDKDKLNVKATCFTGRYNGIDVYQFYGNFEETITMLLDKSNLGIWTQYSPLEDKELLNNIREKFYINVRAFSREEELMDKVISENPEWIQGKGNVQAQKDYLKKKVLIEIYERFIFKVDDDVMIYKVVVKNDE